MHFLAKRVSDRAHNRRGSIFFLRLLSLSAVVVLLGSLLPPVQARPDATYEANLMAAATTFTSANTLATSREARYDETTGHSIIWPLLRFYTRTGGEIRHGKPLSEPIRDKQRYVQYFERSVLEFYPQYAGTPDEVRLQLLGQLVASHAKLNLPPAEPISGSEDKWYFPQVGHSLSGSFLAFWRNGGEAESLGLPLSEEINEDGNGLVVQYFEKVRLQRPASSDRAEDVSLSNLGTIRAKQLLSPAQLAPVPRSRFSDPRVVRVPSLMFHYARVVDYRKDPLGFSLSVTPADYIKFLDWVKTNGYNTVTVSQIWDYLKYGILLPEKPVNFRWDDGHDNNWFVYQEMKKRGMTATFYVVTQRLELTPAQWRQINDDGFEVAPHTRTHAELRATNDLLSEIAGSKHDLEIMLGQPTRSFAYPYGKYNDTIKRIVRESGFEVAVSTNGGYTWTPDNIFEQPVISVTGYDSVDSFAEKITRVNPPPAQAAPPRKP